MLKLLSRMLRVDPAAGSDAVVAARRPRSRFVPTLTPLDERIVPDGTIIYQDAGTALVEPDMGGTARLFTTVTQINSDTYRWWYRIENDSFNDEDWMNEGVCDFGFTLPWRDGAEMRNFVIPPEWGFWAPSGNSTDFSFVYQGSDGGVMPGETRDFLFDTPVVPLVSAPIDIYDRTGILHADGTTVGPGIPPPLVAIGGGSTATEYGPTPYTVGPATFYFRRWINLDQPLTVTVSFNSSGDNATEGTDYTAPHTVTFPAADPANGIDGRTAYLVVTPKKDNAVEGAGGELIHAVLQPGGGYRVSPFNPSAYMVLADDAPRVSASVEWMESYDFPLLGEITVTRWGGDLTQPLQTWVEVDGSLTYDGLDMTPVMAMLAEFPANSTAITLDVMAVANAPPGGPGVDVPDAELITRADMSEEIRGTFGKTNSYVLFYQMTQLLTDPLTYQEFRLMKQVIAGGPAMLVAFGSDTMLGRAQVQALLTLDRTGGRVDWRTLPTLQSHLVVGGGVVGYVYTEQELAKTADLADRMLEKLKSNQSSDRDLASAVLGWTLDYRVMVGDLIGAFTVYVKVYTERQIATDPEVIHRLDTLLRRYDTQSPFIGAYKQIKYEIVENLLGLI